MHTNIVITTGTRKTITVHHQNCSVWVKKKNKNGLLRLDFINININAMNCFKTDPN
jgi:hypothetical protein